MQEIVYYSDEHIWVTDLRVVVGETTYWLADIERVTPDMVSSELWAKQEMGLVGAAIPLMASGCNPAMLVLALIVGVRNGRGPTKLSVNRRPLHIIKLRGKKLNSLVYASFDQEHARNLAALIRNAISAAKGVASAKYTLQNTRLKPPRDKATLPAFKTYLADAIVCVTSEVVHVGHESYPLKGVKAVYVHAGRIDWYSPSAQQGYFVVLNTQGELIAILCSIDADYAYSVRDAIQVTMQEMVQTNP